MIYSKEGRQGTVPCLPGDSLELVYHELSVDSNGDDTTSVKYEVGALRTTIQPSDSSAAYGSFFVAEAEITNFGMSCGLYTTKVGYEKEVNIFGRKVKFGIEANSGVGASFQVGKKSMFGVTWGVGINISLEIVE